MSGLQLMSSDSKIFLIAGEASGDLLGARLMSSLKKQSGNINFSGVGGQNMKAEGLISIFPMEDLSVMGIAEVLPKLSLLLARISETVEKILADQPDVVVSIDAPDFCFRVAKKLKKRGYKGKIVHYVAPSVWAWRPGRAKKVAGFLDHLLCLLPFEPPYFEEHGLPATYIGHSVVESNIIKASSQNFRSLYDVPDDKRIILVLPGSRQGELARHLDLFLQTAETLSVMHPNLVFVMPTLSHLKQQIETAAAKRAVSVIVTDNEMAKYNAFAAADFALAASGTVALELAYANVPSIICYKVNWITGVIANMLVKTDYVSLPNIILGEEVMPELLQKNATIENLVNMSDCFLTNETFLKAQQQKFDLMRAKIQSAGKTPSEKAADVILELIK